MRASLLVLCAAAVAHAAPEKGEIVQSDTLGINIVSYDYHAGTTKTVADRAEPSLFIGLHAFVADRWRAGMNFQLTERLTPAPPAGQSSFRTFALLPQVGWHFYDPFFAAFVVTIAPYIDGVIGPITLGFQLVLGAGFNLTRWMKLNLALEVPWNFHGKTTIGLTPLVGVSFKL